MKKLVTLVIAQGLGTLSFGQWNYLAINSGEIFQLKMVFADANVGFMAGTDALPNGDAKIVKSTNGGQSWTSVYSLPPAMTPSSLSMNDIQLVNGTIAYACGGYATEPIKGIIAKSTNGGTTWDTVPHDILDQSKFLALHFFDATNGLIAGNGLWRTSNAGVNWTPVDLPATVHNLQDLYFLDATTGFGLASTTSALIRTTDGGLTWSSISLPTTEVVNEVEFFDADHGLLVGDNGTTLYSSNGGLTWISGTNSDPAQRDVLCVTMTSTTTGYAGTAGAKILHTSNGGQSWTLNVDGSTLSPILFAASIYDIEFPTAQIGLACGQLWAGLLKTNNGGGAVGIEELDKEALRLAPNPATTHIRYETQDVQLLQLHSMEGRLIAEHRGAQLNGLLHIGDLPPGLYALRAFGPRSVQEGVFIKE